MGTAEGHARQSDRRALIGLMVIVLGLVPSVRAADGEINEGELRFLDAAPPGALFHQHKRLQISPESLGSGWVRDQQCYYNLDPVPALEVVFGAGRVRALRITRTENVGRAWVEGASVQLQNVGARAVLCLESENRVLARDTAAGGYVLTSGPYMRRFLDGYFPMRVTIDLEYPDDLLKLSALEPFDLPRGSIATAGRVKIEALFEGRLVVVARFTGRASAGPP